MGRPRKFDDVKHIEKHIAEYVDTRKEKGKPLTIESLCDFLGVERQTLLNYEKKEGYDEFFDTIKNIKSKILSDFVDGLIDGDKKIPPAIGIFLLKNNYGYRDQQEVKISDRYEVEF